MRRRRAALLAAAALVAQTCGAPDTRSKVESEQTVAEAPAARLFVDATDRAEIGFVHVNGETRRKYLPEIMGSGGSVLDYDGDGLFDLYFIQSGPVPGAAAEALDSDRDPVSSEPAGNRLYRNLGELGFLDVTERAGVGDTGYGMGSVAGDYDRDGDIDLYVVNFGPDVLLRNNGDGTYSDATAEAGISNPLWGSSAAFFDADRDGDLDLFVSNYVDFDLSKHVDCGSPSKGVISYCSPDVYEAAPDVFFENNGDGTFSEATVEAGFVETTGKGLGVVAADFTNDGWPDLYVANDSTPNFLFRNLGEGTFEEAALWLGVGHNEEGKTEAGMGVSAGDVNGDGWLDLLVTNLSAESNALYLGGESFFTYGTRAAGLHEPSYLWVGFGNDLVDLDNDGDLDLVVTNGHVIDNPELVDDAQSFRQPTQAFWNDGKGTFSEVDHSLIEALRVPRVGRSVMTLDWGSNGKQDVIVTYNGDRARLFENESGKAQRWLGIRFAAESAGSRVTVKTQDRTLFEELSLGSSYSSSSEPRLHFGMENAGSAQVRVQPIRGTMRSYLEMPSDRYLVVY